MTNINGWNMRSRCPSSIHVPSDLKDVIVNKHFRLDIKNTPKPIYYEIQSPQQVNSGSDENGSAKKDEQPLVNTDESADSVSAPNLVEPKEAVPDGEKVCDESARESTAPAQINPQPKNDLKLNHKYGVKVVLMALPELDTIYKNVFGDKLDSYSTESGRSRSRLDESISLLCNKGSNGGHSLIGGKFDPNLDGFVEGGQNEFERHGRQPDLIATCRRVVMEQTGLDLSPCRSWVHLSTFMYNNKSDYFSPKASVEYSYIYMPQIWTMAPMHSTEKESPKSDLLDNQPSEESQASQETQETPMSKETEHEVKAENPEVAVDSSSEDVKSDQPGAEVPVAVENPEPMEVGGLTLQNLSDLKVVDLKLELDRRFIKYKPNAKKAELVALLHQCLVTTSSQAQVEQEKTETAKSEPVPQPDEAVQVQEDNQPVESGNLENVGDSEFKPDPQIESSEKLEDEAASTEVVPEESSLKLEGEELANKEAETEQTEPELELSNKRKTEEVGDDVEVKAKKVCLAGEESEVKQDEGAASGKKVELISGAFVVRSKTAQQLLSLVPLYETSQVSRYDQFELSVASNVLKEALVQHLSEYILTALVEDRGGSNIDPSTGNGNSSNSSSSQETNSSDRNNNPNPKSSTSKQTANLTGNDKNHTKEFPVDRYINLACSYFDSTHMGYLHIDDLSKLFNNTGLTISKRALISLIGDGDKLNYRCLADLSPKLSPTYIYRFPDQFNRLPAADHSDTGKSSESATVSCSNKVIEYQGVTYNLESLISQVRDLETMRINMIERFNYAIENHDKQREEIHVLEVSQKSLTNALKSQNDEITELTRERDSVKKKYDNLKKAVKSQLATMTDMMNNLLS